MILQNKSIRIRTSENKLTENMYLFSVQLEHIQIETLADLGSRRAGTEKEEWAVKVDINTPVEDFYKRIPDMAYKVMRPSRESLQ